MRATITSVDEPLKGIQWFYSCGVSAIDPGICRTDHLYVRPAGESGYLYRFATTNGAPLLQPEIEFDVQGPAGFELAYSGGGESGHPHIEICSVFVQKGEEDSAHEWLEEIRGLKPERFQKKRKKAMAEAETERLRLVNLSVEATKVVEKAYFSLGPNRRFEMPDGRRFIVHLEWTGGPTELVEVGPGTLWVEAGGKHITPLEAIVSGLLDQWL